MADWLYRLIRACFQYFLWGGELAGGEHLPERGPAVLVANHLGALGPIAVAASLPRRLYPWIVSAMLDPELAPDYLRIDFVEKEMLLQPPASIWAARALSKISVPLLRAVGCVPVPPEAEGMRGTFEHSLELLLKGSFLAVFPEDPNQPLDPHVRMSPFKKGFTRLGELYYQRTGASLRFYPLAVHAEQRIVQVGEPVAFNPLTAPVRERIRLKDILEGMIHEMYLGLDSGGYIAIPQTRHS